MRRGIVRFVIRGLGGVRLGFFPIMGLCIVGVRGGVLVRVWVVVVGLEGVRGGGRGVRGGGRFGLVVWYSIAQKRLSLKCISVKNALLHARDSQSSSTTSSPYVSSSFASSAALSSAIFCVRNAFTSAWRVLRDEERASRYATRSVVVGGEASAGSSEVKVWGSEVGDV